MAAAAGARTSARRAALIAIELRSITASGCASAGSSSRHRVITGARRSIASAISIGCRGETSGAHFKASLNGKSRCRLDAHPVEKFDVLYTGIYH